jgi:hypothetical protein
MKQSRRSFVKTTGVALTATGLGLPGALASPRRVAPSDRVRVGVIGCNGMGFSNLQSFLKMPEVECAGLCDVDQRVLKRRAADVEEMTSSRPPLYGDFRRMLDADDVDAVIIGTPDHWHCLMMVASRNARSWSGLRSTTTASYR